MPDRPEVVALLDRFLAGTASPADLTLVADYYPPGLLAVFKRLIKRPDEPRGLAVNINGGEPSGGFTMRHS